MGSTLTKEQINTASQKSEDIAKLHSEMCLEINGEIHPNLGDIWTQFKCMLGIYLSQADIAGISNAIDAINLLKMKGIIEYGYYEKLKEIFVSMKHRSACRIITDYTDKIQDKAKAVLRGQAECNPQLYLAMNRPYGSNWY